MALLPLVFVFFFGLKVPSQFAGYHSGYVPPNRMLSAFPESWNYKDREPWEKRSHRLAPLSQVGNENKGSDLMF